ncbi:MAG: tyrosine-type recombinase/integrase [Caldisericia bacterium]
MLRKLDFSSDDPEWDTLLKSIDPATLEWAYRDQAIIVLLLSTGIRRIELANLTMKNVDLKDATITVTRKGGDQQVIELNNDSIFCLEQYLKLRNSKEKSLFVSSKDKKMTPESLHYIVKKIISDCGLKGSAHTLRHTFVTELVRAGVPLPVIQSLVGHRNANTTIRYTHIISKDRRSAVSKINLGLKKTN